MRLNRTEVERLFEQETHHVNVLIGLYKMVLPEWDNISSIDGWPTINSWTGQEISRMFQKFDKLRHDDIMPGGLWLNNGFSTMKGAELANWEVSLEWCIVTYKE